jgi:hypothetical protein
MPSVNDRLLVQRLNLTFDKKKNTIVSEMAVIIIMLKYRYMQNVGIVSPSKQNSSNLENENSSPSRTSITMVNGIIIPTNTKLKFSSN